MKQYVTKSRKNLRQPVFYPSALSFYAIFAIKKRFSLPIQFLFVHLHNTKNIYIDANN